MAGCREDNSKAADKTGLVGTGGNAHGQIVEVTTPEQFNTTVLKADQPVLVDFYATWCGPCKVLAPTIDQLANEYGSSVKFVRVNGDKSDQLMTEYGVEAYPTVMIFSKGKPAKTLIGLHAAEDYRSALNSALGKS
ncbi:MAG: thioredoxin [Planctomycetes bacterium]|nr:thioredoxin [Planctomycetota bacterium]